MKKYLILSAAALLALAACTKQAPAGGDQREISFQVANVIQTKADGEATTNGQVPAAAKPAEFSNEDFGTYAWYSPEEGKTAGSPMFANEKVGKSGSDWKTLDNTYYWPKTGTVDFISYSPYNEGRPAVTETTIGWTGYTVGEKDLMYADKALRQGANVKTYYYNGVPTLFHHALAKVSFEVKANFLKYEREEQKDAQGNVIVGAGTTTWEVTLKSARINGIKTTGDLALKVDADGKWPLPEVGDTKAHVWSNPSGTMKEIDLLAAGKTETTATTGAASGLALKETPQALLDGKSIFVLPQILEASADNVPGQTLAVSFHIKTTLSTGVVIEEDFEKTFDLRDVSSLKAWQMNQNIIYTICIKPTSSDPDNPHTDDPEDVSVTFDPAVSDWETVGAQAEILI